jgi:hypothetical protein
MFASALKELVRYNGKSMNRPLSLCYRDAKRQTCFKSPSVYQIKHVRTHSLRMLSRYKCQNSVSLRGDHTVLVPVKRPRNPEPTCSPTPVMARYYTATSPKHDSASRQLHLLPSSFIEGRELSYYVCVCSVQPLEVRSTLLQTPRGSSSEEQGTCPLDSTLLAR